MENPKSQTPNPNESQNPKSQQRKKPFDLRERTFEFGIRMLKIVEQLPGNRVGITVGAQLARSGTSVGANVEEADGGLSRPEKRHAFVIARKEVREARFWLRMIDRLWGDRIRVGPDISEATEILLILSAIIGKLS